MNDTGILQKCETTGKPVMDLEKLPPMPDFESVNPGRLSILSGGEYRGKAQSQSREIRGKTGYKL